MAGKMQFAAKWFLATTVLAASGTGAWYVTTNGWPSLAAFAPLAVSADATADSEAKDTTFAIGDLDAVASAWAEPAAARQAVSTKSSAIARTADVALASDATAQPSADNRYALASNSEAAVDATEVEDPAETSQPTPASEVEPVAPVTEEQKPATDEDALLSADEAPPSSALARGQEPNDEANPSRPARIASENAEPQPVAVPGQEIGVGTTGNRARDAFRDRAAPPAGDRYGANAAPRESAEPRSNPGLVSPFGSKTAAGSTPNAIEPLPAPPDDIGGRLSDLQSDNGKQQRESDRTTGATGRDAARDFHSDARAGSFDRSKNSDLGSSLPSGGGPSADAIGQAAEGDGIGRPGERALEGPQKPALDIQKFAPGEIQVGKPAKFVVQVRNIGSQAAEGVTISDEVPHGTRLVSTTPNAQSDGGQVVWQLGKLSPGEDRTVEMQVMPTEEGELGSVATVTYAAQASVKTRCTMPQLAIRMTAPNKVMIGQEQRVKIELRNPGSGDATGVMLFENVPHNVKHAAGPALEFDIGTLRAGETRELELVLLAEKAGKTTNVLSARAEGNLQVQQQVEFEVIAPGLTVDLNGPERRYLERPATYEVSVENPGTAPAHDVQIVTKLPKGMRFVRANNMGEYDATTHAVYWSLAELPEGERGTVELVAMPIETGPQTLEVESRAGQGLSDQTQRQIVVDGLAAIMFELRDLEDPIEVGGETGYEIRVVNQGTKAAANLQVAVNLPPGMQVVSAEGETGHAVQGGTLIFEPLPQLAAKADTVYHIRVQGIQAGDQRVTVEVNTDDLGQPIRREESTRVFGDE